MALEPVEISNLRMRKNFQSFYHSYIEYLNRVDVDIHILSREGLVFSSGEFRRLADNDKSSVQKYWLKK